MVTNSAEPNNKNKPKKTSFWDVVLGWFRKKPLGEAQRAGKDFQLEPEYWQEVIEFIDTLNELIKTHTIEDSNVESINRRIVGYIQDQINIKGSIVDLKERYSQLDILADRILSTTFNKIVGLKHVESSHADFTAAIVQLKKRLHERYQNELMVKQNGTI